jgi:SnoaL-like domain
MTDLQAIADRFEIEALRGEFTEAVMMDRHDRLASLFTPDGVLRMPNIPAELTGREEIRAIGEVGRRARARALTSRRGATRCHRLGEPLEATLHLVGNPIVAREVTHHEPAAARARGADVMDRMCMP